MSKIFAPFFKFLLENSKVLNVKKGQVRWDYFIIKHFCDMPSTWVPSFVNAMIKLIAFIQLSIWSKYPRLICAII